MANPKSLMNLKSVQEKGTECLKEYSKKGKESKKVRKKFKEVFEEILTEKKQKLIASEFVDTLLDKNTTLNGKCRIFEIILKIMGEDGSLTYDEMTELTQHIELKIE